MRDSVMQIVHVFHEEREQDRIRHMSEWFGCKPVLGTPWNAVCACGARLVYLNPERTVGGVYHQASCAADEDLV